MILGRYYPRNGGADEKETANSLEPELITGGVCRRNDKDYGSSFLVKISYTRPLIDLKMI